MINCEKVGSGLSEQPTGNTIVIGRRCVNPKGIPINEVNQQSSSSGKEDKGEEDE